MEAIRVRVDSDLKRRFKAACAANGCAMTDIILDAMRTYVAQYRYDQEHTPPAPPQPQEQEATDD